MKYKASDVNYQSATYQPTAQCEICFWRRANARDAKVVAKEHVRVTGHSVRVTQETVSAYYISAPARQRAEEKA